jgi:hypothetical protein
VPRHVLSDLFRGLLLAKLLAAYAAGSQSEGTPRLPGSAQEEALVPLPQAPIRGPQGRARLTVPLHPPGRHLEQPSGQGRRHRRDVQGTRPPRRSDTQAYRAALAAAPSVQHQPIAA